MLLAKLHVLDVLDRFFIGLQIAAIIGVDPRLTLVLVVDEFVPHSLRGQYILNASQHILLHLRVSPNIDHSFVSSERSYLLWHLSCCSRRTLVSPFP